MNSDDDSNPYASPTVKSQPDLSVAESEIHFVIRVFRWVGWLGAIPFVPAALLFTAVIVHSLIAERRPVPVEVVCGLIFYNWSACLSVMSVWVASRMARHKPTARRQGLLLCGVMLIGFPLFTIVGIMCIRKVRCYYVAYCTEHLSRLGD